MWSISRFENVTHIDGEPSRLLCHEIAPSDLQIEHDAVDPIPGEQPSLIASALLDAHGIALFLG
jgi:hypothetical protein